MPRTIVDVRQFRQLPEAPSTIEFGQVPPFVQWVYACPEKGCVQDHLSTQPNQQRSCTQHDCALTYVGGVLEHRGVLYARRSNWAETTA